MEPRHEFKKKKSTQKVEVPKGKVWSEKVITNDDTIGYERYLRFLVCWN